ncbi:MAG: preprotein translocase subunit SecG [Rhodospirillales bacterium]
MIAILTVFHILITITMVGVILIQRSEGGGLGIGGGGGMGGLMSGRGTANILTRATTILAVLFMATSLALTLVAAGGGQRSFMAPAGAPAPVQQQAPAAPAAPAGPSAPVK